MSWRFTADVGSTHLTATWGEDGFECNDDQLADEVHAILDDGDFVPVTPTGPWYPPGSDTGAAAALVLAGGARWPGEWGAAVKRFTPDPFRGIDTDVPEGADA